MASELFNRVHLSMMLQLRIELPRVLGELAIGTGHVLVWDPRDEKQWINPTFFVKRDAVPPDGSLWKTWEKGTPEWVLELVDSDRTFSFDERLEKYQILRIRELVFYDLRDPLNRRLRCWRNVRGELKERKLKSRCMRCTSLGMYLVQTEDDLLRFGTSPNRLLPSQAEDWAETTQAVAEVKRSSKELTRRVRDLKQRLTRREKF